MADVVCGGRRSELAQMSRSLVLVVRWPRLWRALKALFWLAHMMQTIG